MQNRGKNKREMGRGRKRLTRQLANFSLKLGEEGDCSQSKMVVTTIKPSIPSLARKWNLSQITKYLFLTKLQLVNELLWTPWNFWDFTPPTQKPANKTHGINWLMKMTQIGYIITDCLHVHANIQVSSTWPPEDVCCNKYTLVDLPLSKMDANPFLRSN